MLFLVTHVVELINICMVIWQERRRTTALAAALGFAFAATASLALHLREWLRGQTELSRKTWRLRCVDIGSFFAVL